MTTATQPMPIPAPAPAESFEDEVGWSGGGADVEVVDEVVEGTFVVVDTAVVSAVEEVTSDEGGVELARIAALFTVQSDTVAVGQLVDPVYTLPVPGSM